MTQNTLLPYTEEYNTLVAARKNKREFKELTLWDIGQQEPVYVTTADYWPLGEVLKTIGATYGKNHIRNNIFNIDSIIRANTPKQVRPENPFIDNHIVIKTTGTKQEIELSQYACWALMKEIGKNTSTVFQQEYFLNPDAKLYDICKTMYNPARAYLRGQVKKLTKKLHGIFGGFIAHGTPTQYKAKHHAELNSFIARCLYGHIYTSVQDAKASNKIPAEASLYDYMNYELLNAYCAALRNIINTWDSMPAPKTREKFYGLVYNEMVTARTLFDSGRPEQNFVHDTISQIQRAQAQRELAFAQQHINTRLR